MPLQNGWRWCSLCSVLFYGATPNAGHCPAANNGPHNPAGSSDYSLTYNEKREHQQENWRWCGHCSNLHYAVHHGNCIRGSPHSTDASSAYVLDTGKPLEHQQAGWKWCKKCSSLFFEAAVTNPAINYCVYGGKHDATGSGPYSLHAAKLKK
eukprot:TRINITY_DN2580_c0_g2_i1.p1 TRINITY_DN2580_c0_g2~~TRINITY_DN2580_c0_g2_i1.p1  ORF type:complete len:164 (-),score=22.36 TRINITY_DN2580_c0_g2_i1:30-485(-)